MWDWLLLIIRIDYSKGINSYDHKIVSGGQTGANRGGLDAAIESGIPHGGWCPKGRLSEDGTIPAKYNLQEMTSKNYLKRTEQNIIDSTATIVFTYGVPTGGSKRTVGFAKKHNRPCLCVDLNSSSGSIKTQMAQWLNSLGVDVILNVAGSRESKCPGIEERVRGSDGHSNMQT